MKEIRPASEGNGDEQRLHRLRHSTAHVMAEAVGELFPGAAFAIGPPIKDGFYYDVDVSRPITLEDLAAIEKAMKRIVKRNSPFRRRELGREQALELFRGMDQPYKVELISELPEGEPITVYEQGGFTDLCRGPHVQRTGRCRHFKLLKVSGAYWRGDSSRQQLQRIYGTAWPTRLELDRWLRRQEEARKRDHRRLGRELELFMFHEFAPGAPFWLPRGEHLYHALAEAMRRLLLGQGYVAVRTPLLFDRRLWEISGHWQHYADHMFSFHEGGDDGGEGRVMGLKPMNCPSHMLIFASRHRSYRELPLRIHDQGVLHRDELRGVLGGLTRVRQLSQDDAHIFCAEEQVESEVRALLGLVDRLYGAFGMSYRARLSTRPPDRMGDDALWDRAEAALAAALAGAGVRHELNEGDGAFYGPKIDFEVVDALEREWQCATIQLDFQLPRRFDLRFVGADNAEHVPVVIHRAILGSFERFIGILIEHFGGAFPTWLAPEQVRVMTVSQRSERHGRAVHRALLEAGLRATLDQRDAKIGRKIREAHAMRLPYMAIVGEKEQASGSVSVRSRESGDAGAMPLDAFVELLRSESEAPF